MLPTYEKYWSPSFQPVKRKVNGHIRPDNKNKYFLTTDRIYSHYGTLLLGNITLQMT